jgi:site-specific DNA-cytosine methylase
MKVLSLFDGMAAGLQALKELGVRVDEYHAWEIDPHCIAVAKHHHPEIIHHGSVEGADFTPFAGAHLLMGGSPCQGFAALGKGLGLADPRSRLFWEFKRARDEAQPRDVLLENVRMNAGSRAIITEALGLEPVMINSALVSAQRRNRYYWTTLPISQPEDLGLLWRDVWDRTETTPAPDSFHRWWAKHGEYQQAKGFSQILDPDKKTMTLTASAVKSWTTCLVPVGEEKFRFLTPEEAEQLQTLPVGYTAAAGNYLERHKMIGNGWTLEVIKHILRGLPEAQR